LAQLRSVAHDEGVTPEEFAERALVLVVKRYQDVRDQLRERKPRQTFHAAMQEVLTENKELFRRLAQ
jgi:hypothetical protein